MAEYTLVRFSVPFVKGKQRPRFDGRTGRTYTPRDTKQAEQAIAQAYYLAAWQAYGAEPMARKGTPVVVRITCERHLPKTTPRRIESAPDMGKPDLDNVVKLVLDALNGVAYDDDTQVVRVVVIKKNRTRRDGDRTTVRVAWWNEPIQGELRI